MREGGHIWGRYAVPGANSSLLSPSLSHLCPQLHSNACLLPYHSGLGYWGIHHGSPGPRGPSWLLELTISNSLHSKQALAPVAQPAPPPSPGGRGRMEHAQEGLQAHLPGPRPAFTVMRCCSGCAAPTRVYMFGVTATSCPQDLV